MSEILLQKTIDENLRSDQISYKIAKTSEIWVHFDKNQIHLESNYKDLENLRGRFIK